MKWPKVTVVTPSYNQAAYLEAAICSVLDQDYPNLEYFIYDGGSTDGSVDIIKRYSDRVDYWVSQPDDGQASAINAGFKRSTGEIVAWLNSDDAYRPNAIRNAVMALQKEPLAPLVHGNVDWLDKHGQSLGTTAEIVNPNPTLHDLVSGNAYFNQPSAFVQRWAMDVVGLLDPELYYAMDYDWWIRLRKLGPFAFFADDTLAIVNLQQDAKTFDLPLKMVNEIYHLMRRHGGNGVDAALDSLSHRWQQFAASAPAERVALLSADMRHSEYRGLPDDLLKVAQPLLSDIWLGLAFDFAAEQQNGAAAKAMLHGVIIQPQRLFNRGVLAVLARGVHTRRNRVAVNGSSL